MAVLAVHRRRRVGAPCVCDLAAAVTGLYASGGTLAVEAGAFRFAIPDGFVGRDAHHMTLLDIADSKVIRAARSLSGRAYEAWLDGIVAAGGGPAGVPTYVGIGYVEQWPNAVFFEVWEWPEAQAWRADLGLGAKDLHVTICVRGADIHGGAKGRTTLIPRSGPCR